MVPVPRQGEALAAVFAGVAGLSVHVGYMLVEVRLGLERFTAGRTATIRISVPKLQLSIFSYFLRQIIRTSALESWFLDRQFSP